MDPKDQNNPKREPEAEGEAKPKRELTPEEQMARYEEALKEDDWGHQSC